MMQNIIEYMNSTDNKVCFLPQLLNPFNILIICILYFNLYVELKLSYIYLNYLSDCLWCLWIVFLLEKIERIKETIILERTNQFEMQSNGVSLEMNPNQLIIRIHNFPFNDFTCIFLFFWWTEMKFTVISTKHKWLCVSIQKQFYMKNNWIYLMANDWIHFSDTTKSFTVECLVDENFQ